MRLHDRLGRACDNPDSNLRADKCQDSCLIGNQGPRGWQFRVIYRRQE